MEITTTLAILILSSLFLVWLWLRKQFNFWKDRGVTDIPYSFFWGNMKEVILQHGSFADRTMEFYQKFKSQGLKHGGIYFLWRPFYVPIDLTIIKSIMQVDFEHFVDRGMYSNEKVDPISAHLFSLEGKKWKLLRSKLSPTFSSGKIKMMYDTLVNCTRGLYTALDKDLGDAVDIKDILARYTTDVIGSCAFGIDCNSLENPDSEFRKKGKAIFTKNLWENFIQFLSFTTNDLLKKFDVVITPKHISNFFMGVVKDTVAYREKNNIHRKDFMHLLIQLKNKGHLVDEGRLGEEDINLKDNKITIEELAAQAFIFFGAGFETSSTTMTFCLYELARNEDVQNKTREEIRKVLTKYDGNLTYEAVMDMPYLEQVINETLRKYPPVPLLNRVCTKEYKVQGTDLVLQKGVKLLIPVIGIHRDPEYYPDPEKFDPDRFSQKNRDSRPGFTFLPFGEGPRVCIGTRFGMVQTKVGLVALLLNYEFAVNEKTKQPIDFDPQSFILSTKGEIWLNVKRISSQTVNLLPEN